MSKGISIRMDEFELARIELVRLEASKIVPVTRHRLVKEAIRRGLQSVMLSTVKNEQVFEEASSGGGK
jgi:hypothetical protein